MGEEPGTGVDAAAAEIPETRERPPVDSVADEAAERLAKKDRSIRRRVLLTVAPLIVTLLIPWKPGFFWEMNERLDTTAFVAIPLLGLLATVIALAKKRSLLVRSLLLGAVGVGLAWTFFDFMTLPRVIRELASDIQRLDAYALYLGLGLPLFALTMELLAALDRRSRPRALLAGFGWATLALGFLVPMRSDRIESMPFLVMTEAFDDAGRDPKHLILALPMVLFLLFALGNAALTILRLIGAPERRERWRPRSGCMAIAVGVLPPLLIALGFTLQAMDRDIEWMGTAIDGSAWTLAFWVGIPALLAAGLDAFATTIVLAFGRGERDHVRRARLGVGAVSGLAVLWCLTPVVAGFMPDDREDDGGEALLEVAETVVDVAMGAEVDPQFVGGYSEYDLRSSVGVLGESGGGADTALVYATFELVVVYESRATLVVGIDPGGGISYLSGRRDVDTYPERHTLRQASAPLADFVDYLGERLSSLGCLTASAPPELPGLADQRATIALLCVTAATGDDPMRIRDLREEGPHFGGTGAYRIWVRTGDTMRVLSGRLFSHEGRLWIGRATVEGD